MNRPRTCLQITAVAADAAASKMSLRHPVPLNDALDALCRYHGIKTRGEVAATLILIAYRQVQPPPLPTLDLTGLSALARRSSQ